MWSIVRNGVKVDMVSPIEGSVADINEALVNDPTLAAKDPYGDGWMITVQSPDSKTNFRNLLGGALARWWTEESSMRLQRVMPNALGALAQDGGVAIDDLASTMPDEQWTKITREFFLDLDLHPRRDLLLRGETPPLRPRDESAAEFIGGATASGAPGLSLFEIWGFSMFR